MSDVEDIYDYIASDSHFYAKHEVEKIISAAEALREFPESGRSLPEFPDLPHRELIVSSYRIIYRYAPDKETVYIVTVSHCRRLLTEVE